MARGAGCASARVNKANFVASSPTGVPLASIRRAAASGFCARCETAPLDSPGTTVGAPGPFDLSLPVLPTLDAATSLALGAMPAPLLTNEPSATAVSASHSSPLRESIFAERVHHWA